MSTSRYERTTHEQVIYVRGGDVAELRAACIALDFEEGATWVVEGDAVVFSIPMGTKLVGRRASSETDPVGGDS